MIVVYYKIETGQTLEIEQYQYNGIVKYIKKGPPEFNSFIRFEDDGTVMSYRSSGIRKYFIVND